MINSSGIESNPESSSAKLQSQPPMSPSTDVAPPSRSDSQVDPEEQCDTATDWIGELAETARTHERRHRQREHRREHEVQVIAANSQRYWDSLIATVERDLLIFRQQFAHEPTRCLALETLAYNGFRVIRPALPGISLHVQLLPSGSAIEFRYDSAGEQHAMPKCSGTLVFRVDCGDELYLSQYGHDYRSFGDASRMLLERVFKSVAFVAR